VFTSAHWRIYAVADATPLVEGAASLTSLAHDSFALRAYAAGPVLVRVRYTRYLTVTRGRACVRQGPEGWTEVDAHARGEVVIAARFSIDRALGDRGGCR
jgi:hypothetical protein